MHSSNLVDWLLQRSSSSHNFLHTLLYPVLSWCASSARTCLQPVRFLQRIRRYQANYSVFTPCTFVLYLPKRIILCNTKTNCFLHMDYSAQLQTRSNLPYKSLKIGALSAKSQRLVYLEIYRKTGQTITKWESYGAKDKQPWLKKDKSWVFNHRLGLQNQKFVDKTAFRGSKSGFAQPLMTTRPCPCVSRCPTPVFTWPWCLYALTMTKEWDLRAWRTRFDTNWRFKKFLRRQIFA